MGIVTIRALNEPFFYAMVERHVELRFDFLVAAIAQRWLGLDEQELFVAGLVGRVAAQAAQIVFTVSRAGKVHVLIPRAMACQAALVDLLCQRRLEAENLFGVGIFCVGGT